MPTNIDRYEKNAIIVTHLASTYVCGLLSSRVRSRVERLIAQSPQGELQTAIFMWEEKMSTIDRNTLSVAPQPATWKKIQARIDAKQSVDEQGQNSFVSFISSFFTRHVLTAVAVPMAFVMGLFFWGGAQPESQLSYIAVLSTGEQPQIVAATYGNTRELTLEVVSSPDIPDGYDAELWVVSKSDKIVRSLGVITASVGSETRRLSEAEWRLIRDSDSLILTLEEKGGSPFGEPSTEIISQGLCIRLTSWTEEA